MKKFLALFLTCLIILTAFTCCNRANTVEKEKDDEIVIGIIAPFSGRNARLGTFVKNGCNLAVEEINAAGGILGKKIRLNEKDDAGTEEKAIDAFNSLLEEEVKLIAGAVTSDSTFAIADIANKEKAVVISPSATSDTINDGDDFIFRCCYSDSDLGTVAAKFAKDLGYTKAGVVYCVDDAYSKSTYDTFKEACKKYNITIALEESSENLSVTDYTSILSNVTESGIEFLFAPYNCSIAAQYIIPQARQAGYDGIIMGTDVYADCTDYIDNESDLSVWENVIFPHHYHPDSENKSVKSFVAAYNAKYGESPNSLSALAYDTIFVLTSAIENAGTSQDTEAVRASLAKIQGYMGVTGKLSFDESGKPIKDTAVISYTVKDGKVATKYIANVTL